MHHTAEKCLSAAMQPLWGLVDHWGIFVLRVNPGVSHQMQSSYQRIIVEISSESAYALRLYTKIDPKGQAHS